MKHSVQPNHKTLEGILKLVFETETLTLPKSTNYSSNTPTPQSALIFWIWCNALVLNVSYRKSNPIKILIKNATKVEHGSPSE